MRIEAKPHHLQASQKFLAPYRYLFCVDLEATCDEIDESKSPRPLVIVPDQMETIEIDLVVIDLETLKIVDEFQRSSDLGSVPSLPTSEKPRNRRCEKCCLDSHGNVGLMMSQALRH